MTGDPFFAELRRRQPDVDVVVLPPQEPSDRPPADPEAVATAAEATATAVADLLRTAGLPADRTWARWRRRGDGLHEHRTRSRLVTADAADARATFAAVGEALASWGWSVRPVASRAPWVVATNPHLGVDVAVEGVHVVVTATSEPLKLPQDRS